MIFRVFNWAASFGVASVCVAIWLNVEFPPPSAQAQQVGCQVARLCDAPTLPCHPAHLLMQLELPQLANVMLQGFEVSQQ